MNEERQAFRIRQALNQGLNDIPPTAARRLEAARHIALSRQKQAAPELALAGAGGPRFAWPTLRPGLESPRLKPVLAIIALLTGMWLSFYWHSIQYTSEIEAVDTALLTDELPPEAFLDHDFIEWLKDDSPPD